MKPTLASETDAVLAARAAKGDRAAFNAFVLRHQESLYRFIRRYVGANDEAYDLLQEAFVAAWRALGRYDPARPAGVWLRRIALNKCRDWSRRRAVRRFFYSAVQLDVANPAALAAGGASAEDPALALLDSAITRLPPQLKEPLLLTAVEGMSHQEAGVALGISAKAVETRVYRARKLLGDALRAADASDSGDAD